MHQQNRPPARQPLQRAAPNQHGHGARRGAQGGAGKEDGAADQHDDLAAPDIGELGPDGPAGCAGEEVRAADPGVACGGVEVPSYGWGGGGDNSGVEGGDEEEELGGVLVVGWERY